MAELNLIVLLVAAFLLGVVVGASWSNPPAPVEAQIRTLTQRLQAQDQQMKDREAELAQLQSDYEMRGAELQMFIGSHAREQARAEQADAALAATRQALDTLQSALDDKVAEWRDDIRRYAHSGVDRERWAMERSGCADEIRIILVESRLHRLLPAGDAPPEPE